MKNPCSDDLATKIAKEFLFQYEMTRTDWRHMLHGQMLSPWGTDKRAMMLCRELLKQMQELSEPEILCLIQAVRLERDKTEGITLGSVLGLKGEDCLGMDPAAFLQMCAAAGVICRLGDIFDAARTAELEVSHGA